MAEESPIQVLCEEMTCPICLDCFKDPVIIDCGHNFCQACITECCGKSGSDASCPQCRETVQVKNFRPNRQLAGLVEAAKKFSLHRIKGAEASGPVCERHQEPLKLFCQDDEALICVVCDKSKEHREHKVIPKEEAFEECKGRVQTYLEFLKEERESILSSEQSGENEGQTLLEQTEAERQKMMDGFKQLHQFLEEQESRLLAELKGLEDQIKDKRNAYMEKLCEELSSVDLLIKEMEERQKQPASEFLQDIRNILQRCSKQKFVNPVVFPLNLKQEIQKFSEISPFLHEEMKTFQDTVLAGPQTKTLSSLNRRQRKILSSLNLRQIKANMQVGGKDYTSKQMTTALVIPTLVLSTDCPNRPHVDLPYQQPRSFYQRASYNSSCCVPYHGPNQLAKHFSCWSYIMGIERITSGSCSWETNIKDEKFWAVGVALEYFRGTNVSSLSPEGGICAVGKSTDNQLYAFISSGSQRVPCPWSTNSVCALCIGCINTGTIRVSLNYDQGSVTFFKSSNNTVIYTFHNVSFRGQPVSSWFLVGN